MPTLRLLAHALAGLVLGYILTAALGVIFLLPADGGGDAGGTAMGIFFGLGVGVARRRKPPAG